MTYEEFSTSDTEPYVWVSNLLFSSKDYYIAVAFIFSIEPVHRFLTDQILEGDDALKNPHFKLISNIVKWPWIMRKPVGKQVIYIFGKAVPSKYFVKAANQVPLPSLINWKKQRKKQSHFYGFVKKSLNEQVNAKFDDVAFI